MPADFQYKLLFGFRYTVGLPKCPCSDPGTYLMMEQRIDNPLAVRLTCWCHRQTTGTMDDLEELRVLLAKNGVIGAI